MLLELSVRDLGVIANLRVVFGPGMTAVTGETGAGKTLLVEAIELLAGGRADAAVVRAGATEAAVEGRFLVADDDVVLARVVPATGRSRAYIQGRMAPATALSEAAAPLVDLHGQHTHQSLLSAAAQRSALDAFAGTDLQPLVRARDALAGLDLALAGLGGDGRARAREIDLLRHQVAELGAAHLTGPDEDEQLAEEEDRLADATAHREAAAAAHRALAGDGAAGDKLGEALAALTGRAPLHGLEGRLRGLAAEVADAAADLRLAAERLEDDPERLAEVRARRQLLRDLRRKYGETLDDVLAYAAEAGARLAGLLSYDERAAELESQRAEAVAAVAAAAAAVGAARRRGAPKLATAVECNLRELALPAARFAVEVDGPGPAGPEQAGTEQAGTVRFLLGANPGEPLLALSRVASGGELARAMLALRLVLLDAGPRWRGGRGSRADGPATLVFDEVDAGVGGEAALAVGRALATLAMRHQVLVVTHLPQVAAFADHQVAVTKQERGGRTVASAEPLDEGARIVELSRMLSGQPSSRAAHGHAEELLASAARQRGR